MGRSRGVAPSPAVEVAVGVLTQLLPPPTGVGFGLGVAPGAISRTVIQRIVNREQHVVDKRQSAFGASPASKPFVSGSIGGTYEGTGSISLTCESIEATPVGVTAPRRTTRAPSPRQASPELLRTLT